MVTRYKRFALWWSRAGMALRSVLFFTGVSLFAALLYLQTSRDETISDSNNLLFFVLVNLTIVVLSILAFLIGRNIIKLIFDRRKKILGSKLRTRLVFAFVGLSLVPTIFLYVLASGVLSNAMEGWFSKQVETSVHSALAVAKDHYAWLEHYLENTSEQIAKKIQNSRRFNCQSKAFLAWLESRRIDTGLYSIKLIDDNSKVVCQAYNAASTIEDFSEPQVSQASLNKVFSGKEFLLFEEKDFNSFVRAYLPLQLKSKKLALVVTLKIDADLARSLNQAVESFEEYKQLSVLKQPLKSGYLLTLSMGAGLILFAAIWLAFYIAREITNPIRRLAEGTRLIAKGNYDFQLRAVGDDEIGYLVSSFNMMTRDLKSSRHELESRNIYIETILSDLSVGVIATDPTGKTILINQAATNLLELQADSLGRNLSQILQAGVYQQILDLQKDLNSEQSITSQFSLNSAGRELKINFTATLMRKKEVEIGCLYLFDDISQITKAQSMAAWREVARRIAHEIKNPLTPIQLAAQRLDKILGSQDPKVGECTQTIIENVDSIKRLADEFSKFARMPSAEFSVVDLNVLIADTVSTYAESKPQIIFQLITADNLQEVTLDPEQIRRLLINLIENAIFAMESFQYADLDRPKLLIRTFIDQKRKLYGFEVCDNGPGIRDSDKNRVFEPYFTTKSSGTGLGLAIVSSIVNEHKGKIMVQDNAPHGSKFILEIPLNLKERAG